MPVQNLRSQPRGSTTGPIKVSWNDAQGAIFYVQGECIDASKSGLKIRVKEPIPKLSVVSVQAAKIGFRGTACVRHVTRVGMNYAVGLSLNQPIPQVWLEKHGLLKPVPNSPSEQ
jgi:hypothetical protein